MTTEQTPPVLLDLSEKDTWNMIQATLAGNQSSLRISSTGEVVLCGNTAQLCVFLLDVATQNLALATLLAERVIMDPAGHTFSFRHTLCKRRAAQVIDRKDREKP